MRKLIIVSLIVLAVLVLVVELDFGTAIYLEKNFQPPGTTHWFGTNHLGQDVLNEVIVGVVNSLAFAFLVRSLTVMVGLVVGGIAGYYGGWIDLVLSRLVDLFLALPELLLAIGFSVAFGEPNQFSLGLVLLLVSWPRVARIVRSKVLQIKAQTYIEAAIAVGGSSSHILFRHVWLECLALSRYLFLSGFGNTIMAESTLSFLGLGVTSLPTLGILIQEGYPYLLSAPWIPLFPAGILSLISFIMLRKSFALN